MLMAFAMMILSPNGAIAREMTYDFATLAEYATAQDGWSGRHQISQGASYTSYSGLTANYGASTTYTKPSTNESYTVDFSRFAARWDYSGNPQKGWLINSDAGNFGLVYVGSEPRFVITGLRPDDEITIYYHSSRSDRSSFISFNLFICGGVMSLVSRSSIVITCFSI